MTLPINEASEQIKKPHSYQALAKQLRDQIEQGILKPGHRLPSSRELALSLGANRLTVVRCYKLLARRGYIETLGRQGTFVRQRDLGNESQVAQKLENNPNADPLLSGDEGHGNEFLKGALRLRRNTITPFTKLPSDPFGYLPLRKEIQSHLRLHRGIECDVEQIAVFSSIVSAIDFCGRLLLEAGDSVAIENPGWVPLFNSLAAKRANVLPIDVDEEGILVDQLEELAEKPKLVCVTPAHQMPKGAKLSVDRRRQLLEWAGRSGSWILEDDFDSMYSTLSAPPLACRVNNLCNPVFFLFSFGTARLPESRLAFLVIPPQLLDSALYLRIVTDPYFPLLEQAALAEALASGSIEKQVRDLRSRLNRKRVVVSQVLTERAFRYVKLAKHNVGAFLTMTVDTGLAPQTVEKCAADAKLPLKSTAQFYMPQPLNCAEYILNLAQLDEHELVARAQAFVRLIKEQSLLHYQSRMNFSESSCAS